jgi:hypothetical protein
MSCPDLMYAAEAPVPRLGSGAFSILLQHLFREVTGRHLKLTMFGKPFPVTYTHAEAVLAKQAATMIAQVRASTDRQPAFVCQLVHVSLSGRVSVSLSALLYDDCSPVRVPVWSLLLFVRVCAHRRATLHRHTQSRRFTASATIH